MRCSACGIGVAPGGSGTDPAFPIPGINTLRMRRVPKAGKPAFWWIHAASAILAARDGRRIDDRWDLANREVLSIFASGIAPSMRRPVEVKV
jgi:hypothetical protein